MALLKKRKNKQFNYQSRYYKSRRDEGPFKIEYKFDEFRTTVGSNKGLKGKFKLALSDLKNRDRKTSRIILIIALILLFIFLYIIDFDLSIFRYPIG